MLAQSKEDQRPILNITGRVKKKPNQRNSTAANRTNPHKPGSSNFKYKEKSKYDVDIYKWITCSQIIF